MELMAASSGRGSRGSHYGRGSHGRGVVAGGVEHVRTIEGSG